jgi:hypothetical protein
MRKVRAKQSMPLIYIKKKSSIFLFLALFGFYLRRRAIARVYQIHFPFKDQLIKVFGFFSPLLLLLLQLLGNVICGETKNLVQISSLDFFHLPKFSIFVSVSLYEALLL